MPSCEAVMEAGLKFLIHSAEAYGRYVLAVVFKAVVFQTLGACSLGSHSS